jgi:hypothetical protein
MVALHTLPATAGQVENRAETVARVENLASMIEAALEKAADILAALDTEAHSLQEEAELVEPEQLAIQVDLRLNRRGYE